MVKRELALRRVAPVFRESWMRSNRAFMKLRHRSLGPAATAFMIALRAASVAKEAMLEKRWRTLLPPRAVPGNVASSKRRNKRSR
jgi:hypothetical protein